MAQPAPPTSYTTHANKYTQIKLDHVPASSRTATPTILLTLHRPGKHNAFTGTMTGELEEAFGLLDVDERVKCVVVTGHGEMFCAGADLEEGFVGGGDGAGRASEHRDGYVCVCVVSSLFSPLSLSPLFPSPFSLSLPFPLYPFFSSLLLLSPQTLPPTSIANRYTMSAVAAGWRWPFIAAGNPSLRPSTARP